METSSAAVARSTEAQPDRRHAERRLTAREKEVLLLVCEGLTCKEMASRLGISPKTVEFHKARIAEIVGVHSVAGLVRYAVRSGLIEP